VVALTQELGLTNEEFDERTIEQLASFPVDQGRYLIKEIKVSTANICMGLRFNFRIRTCTASKTSPSI
jgi:hypothetical protein